MEEKKGVRLLKKVSIMSLSVLILLFVTIFTLKNLKYIDIENFSKSAEKYKNCVENINQIKNNFFWPKYRKNNCDPKNYINKKINIKVYNYSNQVKKSLKINTALWNFKFFYLKNIKLLNKFIDTYIISSYKLTNLIISFINSLKIFIIYKYFIYPTQ